MHAFVANHILLATTLSTLSRESYTVDLRARVFGGYLLTPSLLTLNTWTISIPGHRYLIRIRGWGSRYCHTGSNVSR